MAYGLSDEISRGAKAYADIMRRWRCAKGIPTFDRPGEGVGSGKEPERKTIEGWARDIARIEHGVAAVTITGFLAMRTIVLDDMDIAVHLHLPARAALIELAAQTGQSVRNKSPYLTSS